MSSEGKELFTRENLDLYLKELAKEYKKLGGRTLPVEMILIGGAAIIECYGFRESTTDIDAILPVVSSMKDAINHVGDRFGLPNGWLNADFMRTDSYSRRLSECSVPYRTFNQVLHVRMVTGEYLIAMKLRAGRRYKNDLSDIVGILGEHERKGKPISYEMIDAAVKRLYGGWEGFPESSVTYLQKVLQSGDYEGIYKESRKGEIIAKEILLTFQEDYPGVMKADNVESILQSGMKKNQQSVLARLNEMKQQSQNTDKN